jgi:aminoglycoside phosphotransferase (APT) family kinase protein
LQDVLSGREGLEAVRALVQPPLDPSAAALVSRALGDPAPDLTLLRTKLKPGRSLTAWYALPAGRQVAVDWALRPRRKSAFADAVACDGGWVAALASPTDPHAPQLARIVEPEGMRALVAGLTGADAPAATVESIETLRYRPGQRHVLRATLSDGGGRRSTVYVKLDRDDSGSSAVPLATTLGPCLTAADPGARLASPLGYAAADHAAVWHEVAGPTLTSRLGASPAGAEALLARLGRALRALHDCAPATASELLPGHDAAAECRATLRAGEIVAGLLPAVGERFRAVADAVLGHLDRTPAGAPVWLHGDVKSDNVILDGDGVVFLDLDRMSWGEPALDLAKLVADLRWLGVRAGADPAPALRGLRQGYGEADDARWQRTAALAALFTLKLAARRTPVHEPGWAARVEASVDRAAREAA